MENCAIMSAKEKEATSKTAFTFLAPSANELSAIADDKARQRGFVSLSSCYTVKISTEV